MIDILLPVTIIIQGNEMSRRMPDLSKARLRKKHPNFQKQKRIGNFNNKTRCCLIWRLEKGVRNNTEFGIVTPTEIEFISIDYIVDQLGEAFQEYRRSKKDEEEHYDT